MLEQRAESLVAPGNLRPAQLGIVLVGRVTVGHISATLADLAQRGFLRIEEVPDGNGTEWVLTDLRGQGPGLGIRLLQFEATLLEGLFSRQEQVQLAGIGEKLIPALDISARVARAGPDGR